jgi:hypothetical protein
MRAVSSPRKAQSLEIGVAREHVAAHHGPGPEALDVALGQPEQMRDREGGNPLGDRREVAAPGREPGREGRFDPAADPGLHAFDAGGGRGAAGAGRGGPRGRARRRSR